MPAVATVSKTQLVSEPSICPLQVTQALAKMCRWLEHDPQELLTTVKTCISKALDATEKQHGKLSVKAVGLTNQRETTIVWDRKTKQALHNAIVWPDSRNSAICTRIQEQVGGPVCQTALDLEQRGFHVHHIICRVVIFCMGP